MSTGDGVGCGIVTNTGAGIDGSVNGVGWNNLNSRSGDRRSIQRFTELNGDGLIQTNTGGAGSDRLRCDRRGGGVCGSERSKTASEMRAKENNNHPFYYFLRLPPPYGEIL